MSVLLGTSDNGISIYEKRHAHGGNALSKKISGTLLISLSIGILLGGWRKEWSVKDLVRSLPTLLLVVLRATRTR